MLKRLVGWRSLLFVVVIVLGAVLLSPDALQTLAQEIQPSATTSLLPTETPTVAINLRSSRTPSYTPSASPTASATQPPTTTGTPPPSLTATMTLPHTATSLPTATGQALPPEPELGLLFRDDFESGDLSAWTLDAGWSLVPVENGLALQTTVSDAAASPNQADSSGDLFNVMVRVRVLLQPGQWARLTVRQSGVGSYAVLLGADGQVQLYRGEALIGTAALPPMPPDQWTMLRLSAMDGVLRVALDSVEVLTVLDNAPLPPGSVSIAGLWADNLRDTGMTARAVRFDNVVLRVPVEELPQPTAPPTPTPQIYIVPPSLTPTATPVVTPPATPTEAALAPEPPLELVFHDTFDDERFSAMLWTLGEGWSFVPSEDGLALQATRAGEPLTLVHDTLGDAVVQARLRLRGGAARLTLRESAAGAYVAVLDAAGQVSLYRGEVLLGTSRVGPARPQAEAEGWHTLRLSALGGVVRVALDDVEVIAVQDDVPLGMGTSSIAYESESGRIDLRTSGLLVDDFWLWIPADNPIISTATPTVSPTYGTPIEPESIELPIDLGDLETVAIQYIRNDGLYGSDELGTDEYLIFQEMESGQINPLSLAWSPDRTQIAFTSDHDTQSSLPWLYVLNMSDPENIEVYCFVGTEQGDCVHAVFGGISAPAWSPDSAWIAYVEGTDDVGAIMKAQPDPFPPADPEAVSPAGYEFRAPDWSPDGTQIVAMGRESTNDDWNIYTMSADGSSTTPDTVVASDADEWYPAWHPTDDLILYNTSDIPGVDQYHDLYVVAVTGGTPTPITVNTGSWGYVGPHDWSPEGGQIASTYSYFGGFESLPFSTGELDSTYRIRILTTDGDYLRTIASGGGGGPSWRALQQPTCPTVRVVAANPGRSQEAADMLAVATEDGLIIHQGPTFNAQHITDSTYGTVIPWGTELNVTHRIEFPQDVGASQVWYEIDNIGWIAGRIEDFHYLEAELQDGDPCNGHPNIQEPTELTFTYDRVAAVEYAITHSYNNNTTARAEGRVTEYIPATQIPAPHSPFPFAEFIYSELNPGNPDEEATGSAQFVSEALWVGGFMMTSGADNNCSQVVYDNPGWRYCDSVIIPGTPEPLTHTSSIAWRVHKGLGQHFTTGEFYIPSQGSSNILTTRGSQMTFTGLRSADFGDSDYIDPVIDLTDENGIKFLTLVAGGTWGVIESGEAEGELINEAGLGLFAEQHLDRDATTGTPLRAGDYIWIDACRDLNGDGVACNAQGEGTPHGAIIAGWQTPRICDQVLGTIDAPVFSSLNLYVSHDEAVAHGLAYSVPYVVDYTTAQSPVPRPFYCTRWDQPEDTAPPGQGTVTRFWEHNYRFYLMPDVITVPIESIFVNPNWHWEAPDGQ